MAEATPQHNPPAPVPHNPPTPQATQVILQSTRDGELQPDAMRGSEHLIKDLVSKGTIKDLESERADDINPQKDK